MPHNLQSRNITIMFFFWLQSPNDAIIQLRFVFAWEIPKITPWSNLFSTGNYLLKTMSEEHVMDLELTQSIKFRKKMYSLRWSKASTYFDVFWKNKITMWWSCRKLHYSRMNNLAFMQYFTFFRALWKTLFFYLSLSRGVFSRPFSGHFCLDFYFLCSCLNVLLHLFLFGSY